MNHEYTSLSRGSEVAVTVSNSPAWGAIVAGAVAGLGTHIVLMMLFTAIGLGAASPATDDNPIATFGMGTVIAWTISSLISLFIGGWVAGRCAARTPGVSGTMHGFLVWCLSTIAAVLLVTLGAGALVGGAASVIGKGASALGKPLAGMADFAKEAADQNSGALASMIDEVSENPQVKAGGVAAARREIGRALRQLFRADGNLRDPEARSATVQALTRSGISQPDADRMVESWTTSIEQLRGEAEQAKTAAVAKTREVADKAAKAIARAELWSFVGFLLGAIAACFGGRRGQRWEHRHGEVDSSAEQSTGHATPGLPGTPLPRRA